MKTARVYAVELKRTAVGRVMSGERLSSVAEELGLDRQRLSEWCTKFREGGPEALRGRGRPSKAEALARGRLEEESSDEAAVARRRIAELERKVGQQQVDLDFFRRALRHVKERQQASDGRGAAPSTKSSRR